MNAIVLVCLLSVSQRPYGATCCNGGCCKARPAKAATSSAPVHPQVSPLDRIYSLKSELSDKGQEIADARKAYSEAKDAAARDFLDGKYESLDASKESYRELADRLDSLVSDRDKLRREIDRVQDLLVLSHRMAWSKTVYPMPRAPVNAIGEMQAYAVRESIRLASRRY